MLTGEGLTEEEWHERQRELQKKAADLHIADIKRKQAERKEIERNQPTPKNDYEAIKLSEQLADRMPIQPLPKMKDGRIVDLPARGPRTKPGGQYLDDGQVPIKKGKVKSKGRVADARDRARKR